MFDGNLKDGKSAMLDNSDVKCEQPRPGHWFLFYAYDAQYANKISQPAKLS